MTSGRDMVSQAQESMPALAASEVYDALQTDKHPVVLDVREQHEWDAGHIPQAVHLSRGRMEGRVEEMITDKTTPIVCH